MHCARKEEYGCPKPFHFGTMRASSMRKLAFLAVSVAVAVGLSPVIAATKADGVEAAVNACSQEALVGHSRVGHLLPLLGPSVDAHRARMTNLCIRWLTATPAATEALLAACLREAALGPRHLHRGRDLDRDHVARQRKLCRKLSLSVTR